MSLHPKLNEKQKFSNHLFLRKHQGICSQIWAGIADPDCSSLQTHNHEMAVFLYVYKHGLSSRLWDTWDRRRIDIIGSHNGQILQQSQDLPISISREEFFEISDGAWGEFPGIWQNIISQDEVFSCHQEVISCIAVVVRSIMIGSQPEVRHSSWCWWWNDCGFIELFMNKI